MPASAAAARNSIAKSRSETASSELAAGRSKPSAAAVAVAVDRKRGAGQRGGAERAFVEAAAAIGEAAAVAPDHLDIGQEMMTEGDRLGDLQMGEAGHHRVGMRLGLVDQRGLQLTHRRVEAVDGAAHPQPEIGRDLIVARARRMQPPGRRADQFGEPRLDVEVDVLVRLAEDERAPLSISARICARPPAIAAPSSGEMMRCATSIAQCASEPAISSA